MAKASMRKSCQSWERVHGVDAVIKEIPGYRTRAHEVGEAKRDPLSRVAARPIPCGREASS